MAVVAIEFRREGIDTEAPPNSETLIFQDLDLNLLMCNMEYGSVQKLKDRRTDLYKIRYKNNGKHYDI